MKLGIAVAFSSVCLGVGLCCNTLAITHSLDQIHILQEQNHALMEVQTGLHIHEEFLDSDNAKLRADIVSLRQDVDMLRYSKDGR